MFLLGVFFNVLNENSNKYFDKEHFDAFVGKYGLEPVYLSEGFTHHDAHAYSSLAFFKDKISDQQKEFLGDDIVHFITADGFGNKQEAISIYECNATDALLKNQLKNFLQNLTVVSNVF